MDRRVDAQKMAAGDRSGAQFDLDSLGHRHPLAQGKLSLGASLAWVIFWGALSFALAFLVRPVCAWLLLAAAGFEVEYCILLRVTPWKTVFTGLNVAVGGLAAPYAVQAAPSPAFILLYFIWAFTWEVGCRNIPNDWTDLEDDVSLGIRTIPLRFGRKAGARVSLAVMVVTVLCSLLFPLVSPLRLWPVYELGACAAAMYFLILPSLAWQRALSRQSAMTFFNRACLYPLALFVIVVTLALV